MASINVGTHPDPAGIRARRFADSPGGAFSVLDLPVDASLVSIFVSTRPVLDALQAALDEIRAAMDAEDAGDAIAEAAGESVQAEAIA